MRLLPAGIAGTIALCIVGSSSAAAIQTQRLHASFSPNRLGASTTLSFSVDVSSTTGGPPSPLRSMRLFLPAGMGLLASELGLANCDPTALLTHGLAGCPANARLGFGTAQAVVPAHPETVLERARVTAMAGPANQEYQEILFYTQAFAPVAANLVFPGRLELEPRRSRYGGSLLTTIPLVPTWPGGPDVALTHLRTTIGPAGLVYTRRAHGRLIRFRPRGITIPEQCPAGGFPLAATLSYLDGTSTRSTVRIPCPAHDQ